jgi:hypothetical protein
MENMSLTLFRPGTVLNLFILLLKVGRESWPVAPPIGFSGN